MSRRLEGKVALISGGARGQGAAHGELFAEEGARVLLGDVLDDAGEATARTLADKGHDVSYLHLDVTSPADWAAAVDAAESRHGKLDVLVNNAGIPSNGGLLDITEEHWHRVIAVNQTGVFLGMRAGVPALERAGGGSIVNTTSIWGLIGAEDNIAYQSSKAAVALMTKSAALTYAARGIRVNTVAPGLVLTPMLEEEGPEVERAVAAATPMRRGAQAREISYGVLYLASDESRFVTGTDLVIDGGFLAQ
jgi:NAD(P)-dependent dehydrogenase (short-subunit alcohol dehydrogenase family)